MQLHSGAPFWLVSDGLGSATAPLQGRETCDAVIVGAGVTGALLADALSAEGADLVVVDRREPGLGSTAASTALLQFEIDVELVELARQIGESDAVRAYRMGIDAIGMLERLSLELGGCGFERRSSLYLASRRRHRGRLEKEAELRQQSGLPSSFCTKTEVAERYSFPCHGAIRSEVAGQLDPLELTRRLLGRAIGRGVRLYSGTSVLSYLDDAGGVRVETDRGGVIRARRIVFAIGYEVPDRLRTQLVSLNSTYALATHPVDSWDGWPDRCLVWESARPYSYLRTTSDNRILIGGADVPFRDPKTRDRLLHSRIGKLEGRLEELLPTIPVETAFAWAGTFGETPDGMPYIGGIDSSPGALFALGYGGNGITFSMIAAKILQELCAGRGHPDAHLFRLDR
jgi:glycine/D-amino acid oxidase-like deaminating enzyme